MTVVALAISRIFSEIGHDLSKLELCRRSKGLILGLMESGGLA